MLAALRRRYPQYSPSEVELDTVDVEREYDRPVDPTGPPVGPSLRFRAAVRLSERLAGVPLTPRRDAVPIAEGVHLHESIGVIRGQDRVRSVPFEGLSARLTRVEESGHDHGSPLGPIVTRPSACSVTSWPR